MASLASRRWSVVILAVLLSGCRTMTTRGLVACPLSSPELLSKIQAVAPLGTPCDEAVRRLEDAGILGTFSQATRSIYYCDTWKQSGDVVWLIDVELLFDQDGKLYDYRSDSQPRGRDSEERSQLRNARASIHELPPERRQNSSRPADHLSEPSETIPPDPFTE